MSTGSPITIEDLPTVFHDLTPIPQDDGPHPVCAIAYSAAFTAAMDYLRAVLRADERSERALRLTATCLKLNPANYTVWHFRRRCLDALSSSSDEGGEGNAAVSYDPAMVKEDLELAAKLGGSNPKNYQIWYHRRALLEPTLEVSLDGSNAMSDSTLGAARKELAYVTTVLDDDAKNYHAWSHRQWIVRSVDDESIWKEEMEYAHTLILEDPRNNSAWNQRWFVAHRGTQVPLASKDAREEAEYAVQGAEIDPYNESPWRYLIGVIKEQVRSAQKFPPGGVKDEMAAAASALVNDFESAVVEFREKLEGGNEMDGCVNLTSAHIDLLEYKGDRASVHFAADLAHMLALEHDKIRTKYWIMREKELRSLVPT